MADKKTKPDSQELKRMMEEAWQSRSMINMHQRARWRTRNEKRTYGGYVIDPETRPEGLDERKA